MNITVTVDFDTAFDGEQHAEFTCELSDEQFAMLQSEGVIYPDDDEPNTFAFDEDRLGEDADADSIGADELVRLADLLLRFPRHKGHLTDSEALDMIAYCLSAPSWSVSFLEDIHDIVNRTDHHTVKGGYWAAH
jgi:hypothetical protein